jgi:hypothetical protein
MAGAGQNAGPFVLPRLYWLAGRLWRSGGEVLINSNVSLAVLTLSGNKLEETDGA